MINDLTKRSSSGMTLAGKSVYASDLLLAPLTVPWFCAAAPSCVPRRWVLGFDV